MLSDERNRLSFLTTIKEDIEIGTGAGANDNIKIGILLETHETHEFLEDANDQGVVKFKRVMVDNSDDDDDVIKKKNQPLLEDKGINTINTIGDMEKHDHSQVMVRKIHALSENKGTCTRQDDCTYDVIANETNDVREEDSLSKKRVSFHESNNKTYQDKGTYIGKHINIQIKFK